MGMRLIGTGAANDPVYTNFRSIRGATISPTLSLPAEKECHRKYLFIRLIRIYCRQGIRNPIYRGTNAMDSPSQKAPRSTDKKNLSIRTMLASIERTFLPVGSMIGKYRIIEEIDRGGMAVVYKAMQLDLDREVALKVMPANITINRNFVERFLTEAHAVARLSHSNIVNIHEVAAENNIYYLVMDYIPGKNLFYYLHFHKPKLVDVLEIIAKLADALAYAHDQKIIHRDLKLNNVIMKDNLMPVLIDFGLAKAMESDDQKGGITRTGEIMGSPSYMAPERLLGGKVDQRSDICSLGIMLYEMLTFKNPYLDQRNLHQTTINVMESSPIPPRKLIPWLPVEIEAITLKAMAKDPQLRYQTMEEFKLDIQRYQRGEAVLARPPSLISHIRRFIKKYWPFLSIGILVTAFATSVMVSMYIQNRREQSHWQLIYNDKSGLKSWQNDWVFSNGSIENNSCFSFKNGSIATRSPGMVFSRLQQRLTRDIMIECDILSDSGSCYNAGVFLFGEEPDSSICFYLNYGKRGLHGIILPRNSFLLQDAEPAEIPFSSVNHIVIERIQNSVTFKCNDVVVTKTWDFRLPIGKGHDRMGFFVNNGRAVFDNLKIYRRATPQVPSPALIADRFWERGDFESALDEYQSLLQDENNNSMAAEIHLKIADCLIRLNRPEEAQKVLYNKNVQRRKEESIQAEKLFLEAIVFSMQKNDAASDSVLRVLSTRYPFNPVNISAMLSALERSVLHIDNNRPDLAEHEIEALIDQYKRFPHRWGKLYLKLLRYQIEKERYEEARKIVFDIVNKHDLDNSIVVGARTALAETYLHQGKTDQAKELLDQLVTGHSSDPNVWDAWFELAGIYEYEFLYKDALTLYGKIARECPKSSPVSWMSLVKTGELLMKDSLQQSLSLFSEAAGDSQPFPIPRLIAQFYKGNISESDFKTQWQRFFPEDNRYLYYFARKAYVSNEQIVAKLYLNELKRKTSKKTWLYFKVLKIVNNIQRW
jgi:serine/threonine protein kinase/tetratricopeptide (TPR) repeat protein